MDELHYIGNTPFTQPEIDAIEKAIEDTQRNTLSEGIHSLLEEMARRDPKYPDLSQYQIDAYLEEKGLKSPDTVIPPRTLAGGYKLVEEFIQHDTILPCWNTRSDGAILYSHQW